MAIREKVVEDFEALIKSIPNYMILMGGKWYFCNNLGTVRSVTHKALEKGHDSYVFQKNDMGQYQPLYKEYNPHD